jgi:cyclophilin family peptidyl-prolyl cis-trans isomerase
LVDLEIRYVGTIHLELFDRDKPASVKNFLQYIFNNGYTNNLIHRAVTNSLFQGGSLQIIDFGGGSKAVVPVAEKAAVTNELMSGSFFSNVRGTIALAHYPGQTNNATCHWFINLADNTYLDAPDTNNAYVVFGRVISGLENLDKLNPGPTNTTIKILNLGGYLTDAPVRPTATLATVTYDDLLTVTYHVIALDMNLQYQSLSNNVRSISWQSVSNKQHILSSTSAIGSTWTNLLTTNGNGAIQTYRHTNNSANGFYRVQYQP